jgi:syntaxin 5
VVMLLQNKLADTSMTFKDVLEVRTQVRSNYPLMICLISCLKPEHERIEGSNRTVYVVHSGSGSKSNAIKSVLLLMWCPFTGLKLAHLDSLIFSSTQRQDPMGDGLSGRPDTKGKGRATPNDGMLALDLDHAEGGTGVPNGGNSAFQQMELVEQQVRPMPCFWYRARSLTCPQWPMQDSYIQSRSTAIESIETTIAELGQIFNQLAHMVAEQRETVQRIDADTFDIASNVGGAQRELLKYYSSISSNRWLMLKVFGVLIVFVRCSLFLCGSFGGYITDCYSRSSYFLS